MIQMQGWDIHDGRILRVIQSLPRDRFVPASHKILAYEDIPLPIGYEQTISQPYIVAYMTEQLSVEQHHRVLEIGTGSGYQTAVLAELTESVYTIERIAQLSQRAVTVLHDLGYSTIHTAVGNGRDGWPDEAPFDRIIVTAASRDIPPILLEQLAPEGRMVIPLGEADGVQYLYLFKKSKDGVVTQRRLLPVRFVPLF